MTQRQGLLFPNYFPEASSVYFVHCLPALSSVDTTQMQEGGLRFLQWAAMATMASSLRTAEMAEVLSR